MIDNNVLDRLSAFLKQMEERDRLSKQPEPKKPKRRKGRGGGRRGFEIYGLIPLSDDIEESEFFGVDTDDEYEELEDYLLRQEQRKPKEFVDMLIDFMNERNMSNRDLCENAYISTAFLSKIMCNNKPPKRQTIQAIALALHLKEQEFHNLLASASMAPDFGSVKENIVRFCLEEGLKDERFFVIHPTVNELLGKYGQEQFDYKHRKRPVVSEKCTGCGLCVREYPNIFEMRNGKAARKDSFTGNIKALSQAVEKCPANAIEIK